MTLETDQQAFDAGESAQPANPTDAPSPAAATPEAPSTDVSVIRELVLRAHPEVVPEMVTGDTVDALLASIEPAEAAFRRISESVRGSAPASALSTPAVPAGGDRPMPVDPDRIPASEKIRRGLSHR